jgi:hypothetical protein
VRLVQRWSLKLYNLQDARDFKVSLSLRIPALGLFRGGLNQRVAVLDHINLEICDSTSDKPPALMLELEIDALANERY